LHGVSLNVNATPSQVVCHIGGKIGRVLSKHLSEIVRQEVGVIGQNSERSGAVQHVQQDGTRIAFPTWRQYHE